MNTIEILISAYLDNADLFGSTFEEDEVSRAAAALDEAVSGADPEHKDRLCELTAEYEFAARRAGFYAGFRAALSIFTAR